MLKSVILNSWVSELNPDSDLDLGIIALQRIKIIMQLELFKSFFSSFCKTLKDDA